MSYRGVLHTFLDVSAVKCLVCPRCQMAQWSSTRGLWSALSSVTEPNLTSTGCGAAGAANFFLKKKVLKDHLFGCVFRYSGKRVLNIHSNCSSWMNRAFSAGLSGLDDHSVFCFLCLFSTGLCLQTCWLHPLTSLHAMLQV